ncbi:hypothetical protein [Pedobacter sp. N23S346]|uniref:hypothetical protein n=1 Tax=Pedobacter sp. N23S346 TaxID=3402750 RepID=UPI003AD60B32
MKTPKSIALILVIILSFIYGCKESQPKNESSQEIVEHSTVKTEPAHFEIINEVKSETSGKAQLLEYAVYTDSVYTEEALKNTVKDIYNSNCNKDVFLNHDRATVIGVYLFTSKETYQDKSNWIAMLMKGPGDSEPIISYNSYKVRALSEQNDKVKSKDEIELEKLNRYLSKRGLELCSFSAQLLKMEQDHIDRADAAYPDFGPEHLAMVDRLDEQAYRALKRKYKLSDNTLTEIHVFAMSYCK